MLPVNQGYPVCSWSVDGEACRYPGSMTASTQAGDGTQWFCSLHFGCEDPQRGGDIVRASRDYEHKLAADDAAKRDADAQEFCRRNGLRSIEEMREFVRRGFRAAKARRGAGLQWAHRICERHASGEAVDMYTLQLAQAALTYAAPQGRDDQVPIPGRPAESAPSSDPQSAPSTLSGTSSSAEASTAEPTVDTAPCSVEPYYERFADE